MGFLPASLAKDLLFIENHEAIRSVSVESEAHAVAETVRRKGAEDTVVGSPCKSFCRSTKIYFGDPEH